MRHFTMYMDESGTSNMADFDEDFFILSGLIVEDKTDQELSSYFKLIKRRHGIDEETSLHAYDLFENEKSSLFMSDNKKCKEFLSSVVEYVENSPFQTFVFFVRKSAILKRLKAPTGYSFKGSKKHKEDKDLPYEILGRKLIFEFAKFLKKQKAIGSIVAESRRRADTVLLKAYVDSQEPQTFEGHPNLRRLSQESKERVNSICFANKKSLKGGLELIDMVSYFSYNSITGKFPLKRSDRKGIKNSWKKIENRIHKKSPQQIEVKEISGLIPNRINEISKRVSARLDEFRDLVNPTRR